MQRFAEQKNKDAEVLLLPWPADRSTPDTGELDFEEFVPKSDPAPARARGKTSAHEEEGDSDEVQVLEVVAAMPISYAFPASTFPANPAGQVHDAEPIASRPLLPRGNVGLPLVPQRRPPRNE